MNKVDIIIPIYNAYEFTKKCIETIIENTDLKNNNLVLVNDKSPDEKIEPLLKKFKNDYKELNIIIIENEENFGFVKTVNKGMIYSQNDVILLNSDTEVTSNWLEKLRKVAYIKNNVATVTPLSNNATLASIPNFLEENDLPKYLKLEEYAKEIEECSFNDFPEISTAHGFCMYIKRQAIKDVGLFDDVTFEKGYGEENDFSYRCMKKGYVHLLCDNTFIYHKGTQSFTEKKQALINSHLQILQKKYPQNFEMTNNLCITNPISYIQDNIKYYVNNKHRKNILIVVHEFRNKQRKLLGGTVLHIYDLIDNLRDKMNFHVLYPENNEYKIASFFENSTSEIVIGKISSYENILMYNNDYKKIINTVFDLINIDFIHVHHMLNHFFDLFDIINEKNIPYIVSLHDFYFICPTILLLENNEKYCAENENCNCETCLEKLKSVEGNLIDSWRNICYNFLKNAKQLIIPSNSAKTIFNKYYKDLNISVITHGEDKIENDIIPKEKTKKKNIAFIGGINKSKGIDILEKFVNEVSKEDCKFNLHVFGSTSKNELNVSKQNYFFHGLYNRENIVKLLKENNIDLVCLFSIWPETYSYTLTEALLAETPVIALDYGALSERISNDDLGWILKTNVSFEEILSKINEVLFNENEYNLKVNNIKKYLKNLKSIKNMVAEYEKIYDKYIVNKKEFKQISKKKLIDIYKYSKQILDKEKELSDCYNRIGNDDIKFLEHNQRIADYHYTVTELRKEIDRLNSKIEEYSGIEEKYKKLTSSRKMKLLKKLKIIKY